MSFLCTWIPVQALGYSRFLLPKPWFVEFCRKTGHLYNIMVIFTYLLAVLHSFLNPIIYYFIFEGFNKDLKIAFNKKKVPVRQRVHTIATSRPSVVVTINQTGRREFTSLF